MIDGVCHIGILGDSGVGKSSLINAILNKKPTDSGAAKVNAISQETINPNKYKISDKVYIWDMPGVGTPEFPLTKYFKLTGLI